MLPSTHVVNHVVRLRQPNLGIDRCGVCHQNRSASSLHWSSARPNNKTQTSCGPWTAVRNVNAVCRGTPESLSVSFKISSWVTIRVLFRAVKSKPAILLARSCGGAGYEEERVAKIDSQAFPLLYYHYFSFLACPPISLSLSKLFSFSHLQIAPSAPTIGLP